MATLYDPEEIDNTHEKEAAIPSHMTDVRIRNLDDWRGELFLRMREVIRQADRDVLEAVTWRKPSSPMGAPALEHVGIVCTAETDCKSYP